ncbi:MAG: tetratricopeptide repeat protein [Ardenticatenales bacterium]
MTQNTKPSKGVGSKAKAGAKAGAQASSASDPARSIEIGGRAGAVLVALIVVALLGGIGYRVMRSGAGAQLQVKLLGRTVPVPAPPAADLAAMEPDVRDAIQAASRAIEADRGSSLAWRHLGMIYDAHSLWSLAREAYKAALTLAPNDGQTAYYYAGATELAEAPIDEIVAAYQRAIALAPDYGPAHLRLGDALMRAGRNIEARDELTHAVRVYPQESSARARRSLGLVLLALGDADGAVTALEQAVQIRGDDANTWKALAQAYNQLGRGQDARQAVERAGTMQETLGYFDNWRMAMLDEAVSRSLVEQRIAQKVAIGAPDLALADALAWERRHPDWPSIKRTIGNLYRTAGRQDLAQPYFDAATTLVKSGKTE